MEIKYHVNEEKKTVTCILTDTEYTAVNNFYANGKFAQLPDSVKRIACVRTQKYLLPCKFVATVKCNPDDNFTQKKGKYIAYHKAMEKYYRATTKIYESMYEDLKVLTMYAQSIALDADSSQGFHFRKFYENK